MRGVAAALGMTPSKYAHYEDARKFKKPFLPMELVRSLVPILTARGIPEAEVLALAGVDAEAGEVVPLPRLPEMQFVTLQVALPSEAALARMFEGLLRPIDRGTPVAELAQILARRLPTGLAQLRDLMPAHLASDRGEAARPPATDRPEQPPSRRT